MPLPIPDWMRQNLAADFGVGIPFALGLYLFAEAWTHRRAVRRQAAVEARARASDRRLGNRATEVAGATDEQQVEDLTRAIDIMVAFIDERLNLVKTRTVVRQLTELMPTERRGVLTSKFLDHAELGATPVELRSEAEQVCLQLAVELRAVRNRMAAAEAAAAEERIEALRARRRRPRVVAEAGPAAVQPARRRPKVKAPQPRWAREEATLKRTVAETAPKATRKGRAGPKASPKVMRPGGEDSA
jgi:hypothetical protein